MDWVKKFTGREEEPSSYPPEILLDEAGVGYVVLPDETECPNCGGATTQHGDANPHHAGFAHCDSCGTCTPPTAEKEETE